MDSAQFEVRDTVLDTVWKETGETITVPFKREVRLVDPRTKKPLTDWMKPLPKWVEGCPSIQERIDRSDPLIPIKE